MQAKKQFNQYLPPMDGQTNGDGEQERTERGLAYHAFLEYFDFALLYDENGQPKTADLLGDLVDELLECAKQTKAFDEKYFAYLEKKQLLAILSNGVFAQLKDCVVYKEKQFLAGLTISEVLSLKDGAAGQSFGDEVRIDESADDEIIFQGAFDLLAIGDQQAHIIDYKYSTKDEQYLREHYALQLALYKKVVAKVLKIPMQNVRCTIVNIARGFQVEMP